MMAHFGPATPDKVSLRNVSGAIVGGGLDQGDWARRGVTALPGWGWAGELTRCDETTADDSVTTQTCLLRLENSRQYKVWPVFVKSLGL